MGHSTSCGFKCIIISFLSSFLLEKLENLKLLSAISLRASLKLPYQWKAMGNAVLDPRTAATAGVIETILPFSLDKKEVARSHFS